MGWHWFRWPIVCPLVSIFLVSVVLKVDLIVGVTAATSEIDHVGVTGILGE